MRADIFGGMRSRRSRRPRLCFRLRTMRISADIYAWLMDMPRRRAAYLNTAPDMTERSPGRRHRHAVLHLIFARGAPARPQLPPGTILFCGGALGASRFSPLAAVTLLRRHSLPLQLPLRAADHNTVLSVTFHAIPPPYIRQLDFRHIISHECRSASVAIMRLSPA